ncbi:MAG: HD domain-containing protein [Gammaproteobacteria bacterium]|nr:HD domain-containing protein [Gammaproteobacteria bacterium]
MKNYSVAEALDLFNEDLFREIILSPEVMRLRDISFLGSIEKTDKVKKTSRFDHSIGVAYLAYKASKKLNLDSETKKHLIIASLLHDIGHGPLSHSLEPIIKDILKIDHSTITKRLIVGTYKLATEEKNNICKILKKYNIDRTKITNILNGKSDDFGSLLFKNPFNIDTLDGINRVAFSLDIDYIEPEKIVDLFYVKNDKILVYAKNKNVFDSFWDLKAHIYSKYIYDENNLSSELLMQKYYKYILHKKHVKNFALMDDNNLFAFFKEGNDLENVNGFINFYQNNNIKIKHNLKWFFKYDTNCFYLDSDEIDLNNFYLIYKRESKEKELEISLEKDKIMNLIQ